MVPLSKPNSSLSLWTDLITPKKRESTSPTPGEKNLFTYRLRAREKTHDVEMEHGEVLESSCGSGTRAAG